MDMTLAEEPKPNWEQIKKDAIAEKEALDAQKQLADARKLLEAAQAPADPTRKAIDDKVAAANAAKSLADAEKAAADSKKAQADASLATLKAQIGDVPTSGFTGDVTLKEKAGVIEAALLSAKAVNDVSSKISEMIGTQTLKGKNVLLYSGSEVPNFQALLSFRAQLAIVQNALRNAQTVSSDAAIQAPAVITKAEALPYVAAAGLALDAMNKVIGYFRTDYTVGGIEVAVEDSMLVNSLASSLIAKNGAAKVRLPALYNAPAVSSSFDKGIGKQLTDMAMLKGTLQIQTNQHEKVSAEYTEKAGKEPDPTKKAKLLDQANLRKEAADSLKGAINAYDAFYAKLGTADDKGTLPLTSVIREEVVVDALKENDLLLLVKVHKSGGAYYTKKNLWTFLGGMPFYHMGGVIGSFVLVGGKEGEVLASGVIPVHGGFVAADDLKANTN